MSESLGQMRCTLRVTYDGERASVAARAAIAFASRVPGQNRELNAELPRI